MQPISFTITDTAGNVIPSASVAVVLSGTATLATLYADVAGSTPLANPFSANPQGQALAYAADGLYDLQACPPGGTLVTLKRGIRLISPGLYLEKAQNGGDIPNKPAFLATVGAEVAGAAATLMGQHVAAMDPHPQYSAALRVTSVNGLLGDVVLTAANVGADPAGTAATAVATEATARIAGDAATLTSAQNYADGLVVGLWDDRGEYDASSDAFPTSADGGSGPAGAIRKGDIWTISVAGVLGGTAVSVGGSVRALVDDPGQTAGNWATGPSNTGYVPFNAANVDTDPALTANSDAKVASQKATKAYVDAEATARGNADVVLQGNIDGEATARGNADTTLQANITAEATARANADTALQNSITAEVTARNTAIAAKLEDKQWACSDLVTGISAGTGKGFYGVPYPLRIFSVFALLTVAAQVSGLVFTVNVKKNGVTILSTNITIANGATYSANGVVSGVPVACVAGDILSADVVQIGDGTAKGLIVGVICDQGP